MSRCDPWTPVSPHGTLAQLIEIFTAGLHRVPVVDDLSIVSNIVSQSDVIRYLSDHVSPGAPFDQTVKDLNLGSRNVIDMSVTAQAIHAFYLCFAHKGNLFPLLVALREECKNCYSIRCGYCG